MGWKIVWLREIRMSSEQQNAENHAPEDDQVVGRALKLSAFVVLAIAAVVAAVVVLRPQDEEVVPEDEVQSSLPTRRDLPPLEIPNLPFRDITASAGIDFIHENGAAGQKLLPETMSGGGAFFDFDADGDQDILCVNSMVWPWAEEQPATALTSALYENDGTGNFKNVTAGSGLDVTFYGNGVACGDYDNDGLVDLFITAVGPNRLFHNEGNGKFTDVSSSAGVSGSETGWGTSAGWFDYDQDGDLDLMHCNYLEWTREKDESMEFTLNGTLRGYGRPTDFRGDWPQLYRNDGKGKFTDVSAEAGIQIADSNTDGEPLAKSLGLTFADVNADNWLDVVIANDTVQNLLLINQQNGTFIENAASSGVAFANDGKTRGAMGIDIACFRNSDALGITIGNFANEMTALYVCQTPGFPNFRDEAVSNGIGPVTRTELTFGVMFADLDLDKRLDIIACNGHLEEDIQEVLSSQTYEQPPQILWNCGPEYDNEFMIVPEENTGAEFAERMVGRGAARADIDNDGDLDLVLFSSGGRPRLLRNEQNTGNHWARFKLVGSTGNMDAIGATVRLTLPDDTILTRTVMPTCSYQSQSELPVTFGLGDCDSVKSVGVTWPSGESMELDDVAIDTLTTVQESN